MVIAGDGLARTCAPDSESLVAFRAHINLACSRSLSTLIEHEIIPRLMVAHATETRALPPEGGGDHHVDPAEIAAFAPLAMQIEADALLGHVEAILARGVSVETVMVDLLAPAARLLGEYWDDDRCGFVDVTMGLWRLQEIVNEIAGRGTTERGRGAGARRALFASMPGDQHSFGTLVVDEVFRRGGWATDRLSDAAPSELFRAAATERYDMIGLTISCDCHIATLPSIIAALRNVSRNPRVCIMVGGRIFGAQPELAAKVGADGTASDARLALAVAGDLVRERERGTAAS